MSLPMTGTQRPHMPTLVSAILVVIVLLVIYHLAAGRRR